jgi:uncharacterized membrane protein
MITELFKYVSLTVGFHFADLIALEVATDFGVLAAWAA